MTEATWRTLAQLLDQQAEQDRKLLEQVREMLRAVEAKHANDLWAQRPALRAGLELLHTTLEGRCGNEYEGISIVHNDTLPEGAVLWRGKRIDTHPDFDRERWERKWPKDCGYLAPELDALAGYNDD